MKKIAIFGGTFDPIHIAHITLAKTALNELGLDKLVFMPNSVSPFKLDAKISSAEHRCNMIELVIASDERLDMTRYEIEKKGISYTYDTLSELSAIYDAHLYFVLGYDSVVAVDSWYRGTDILSEFALITAVRPGIVDTWGTQKIAEYREVYDAAIHILHMPPIDCSSSQIRALCKKSESITGLVDANVEEYIIKNGLYKD